MTTSFDTHFYFYDARSQQSYNSHLLLAVPRYRAADKRRDYGDTQVIHTLVMHMYEGRVLLTTLNQLLHPFRSALG
jgi:hypothetical protein